jgi:hypothetical protein
MEEKLSRACALILAPEEDPLFLDIDTTPCEVSSYAK